MLHLYPQHIIIFEPLETSEILHCERFQPYINTCQEALAGTTSHTNVDEPGVAGRSASINELPANQAPEARVLNFHCPHPHALVSRDRNMICQL